MRSRPKILWRTAVLVRPNVPVPATHSEEENADPLPELRMDLPPPPPPLSVRNIPPRPRVAAPSQTADDTETKPEAPLIAPQVTDAEASAAKQQMNFSLSVAEKNLARIKGRTLNPVQTDLASKVRGFISDARGAARASDWTRARDLARKAQVLSEELAHLL
ncbi:MAG TPA: hypothetical protein VOA64_21135 [Candidatus Dormibacteraeota bacterium]|nr:hypothetical protein [Candidatus Dormibacteraeota bacterium]